MKYKHGKIMLVEGSAAFRLGYGNNPPYSFILGWIAAYLLWFNSEKERNRRGILTRLGSKSKMPASRCSRQGILHSFVLIFPGDPNSEMEAGFQSSSLRSSTLKVNDTLSYHCPGRWRRQGGFNERQLHTIGHS
ncbi:hypothetical protein C8R43DRAFT_952062 [Mycena crocata]|nr:hypothetical protein C8R43DRAFT_952062 [Mycena crocata]